MNLTQLRNYAPAARNAFIAAVTQRAVVLGIQPTRGVFGPNPDAVAPVRESGDVALIGGRPFPRSIVPVRRKLISMIESKGFQETMEAMAYTWFNRLVALRFMELHDGYLDHGYRVLSHPQGTALPEILQHAEHVSLKGLDREEVIRLKLDGNRDEELYRLLLLAQCAELNHILPDVFSKLDDATILLLPDNLLHSDSVIRQLIAGSAAEDWQQVEVLGWLYQFYISEKKDQVMARKSAVPTEDIPAVTQLFTPHWIVRYLVENSLGRLWLLNRPGSRLREHMPYYIEGEKNAPGGSPDDFLKITKPEEIRLCDPACGSGHMLTYAFDLLTLIYEEEGYAPTEIPALILRHNLHGLEICPRAAQLAELALVFKAREKSRRFFQPEHLVRPHIIELRDVRFDDGELSSYFAALGVQPSTISPHLVRLLHQFEEAKNFGSLIQPCMSEAEIQSALSSLHHSSFILHNSDLLVASTHLKVLRVLEQAEALTQRYHLVVANPPYLGNKGQSDKLKLFLKTHFEVGKHDLFSAFILRNRGFLLPGGISGMMTPFTWFFILTYSELRKTLLQETTFESAIIPEYHSFFESAFVPICAFVFRAATPRSGSMATFIDLEDFTGSDLQEVKTLEAIRSSPCTFRYSVSPSELLKIPGSPFAYKLGKNFLKLVANGPYVGNFGEPREGINTGDNERFLRFWFEVGRSAICIENDSAFDHRMASTRQRWFPCNKGGSFRRWYGNNEYVVDWSNDGYEIRNFRDAEGALLSRPQNTGYFFREGATWSGVGLTGFSARYFPPGFAFNSAGRSLFAARELIPQILAALNSNTSFELLKIVSPTLSFTVGNVASLPFKPLQLEEQRTKVEHLFQSSVAIARADWDNFETSWDFRDQPLLRPGLKGATLEASWRNWEAQSTAAIRRMQELETENNRLFIAAYGLDGELQPEVPEAQITLARAETRRDMAAFLSYAVGCMMGRYGLDHPGLILANAGDSLREFLEKVGKPLAELTFAPDEDGIIPVLDGEWFEDDIVARTRDFLRATFGEATLNENLRFIEQSLGRELRDYFLTDFYKDHLQTYKNRPIYWLFSSGKQKAFQCLVYLHRYTPGTLARMRTEYAIPLQGKLGARITRLEEEIPHATGSTARKKLQTELDQCKKQMVELLTFDEQLRSYADQAITLDLDNGVKTNYTKFGPLVAESKKVCGTKDD